MGKYLQIPHPTRDYYVELKKLKIIVIIIIKSNKMDKIYE
jgi:mannitol/fructose-specific phosphotransferase system IIA component